MGSRWPKKAGRKPTKEFKLVRQHHLAINGSKSAVVAAMLLRSEGVTQPQIIEALGNPYRNKLKQLMEKMPIKVTQEGRVKTFRGRVN